MSPRTGLATAACSYARRSLAGGQRLAGLSTMFVHDVGPYVPHGVVGFEVVGMASYYEL